MMRFAVGVATAAILMHAPAAAAAAWTLPKGDGQAILTLLGSDSPRGFEADGRRVAIADYDKAEAYLLVEYGLTDAVTLVLTPSLRHVSVDDASRDTDGLGYTELGARWRVGHVRGWVASLQATARIPGAERRDGLVQVDSTGEEYDVRGLLGRSFTLLGRSAFLDLQGGYRVREGGPPDEWRADLTLGVRPWPRVQVLAQSFNVASNGAGTGIFGADRYDNLALSGVYDLTRRWSVQVGGYATLSGRNALDERGGIVSVWWRFGGSFAPRPPTAPHR